MKKITLLIAIFSIFGCSKEDEKESYTFKNNTDYNVIVSPFENLLDGAPMFHLPINAHETKTYQSDYKYSIFDIKSSETTRSFTYDFLEDIRVINFTKIVEYRISGTATSVDLTYTDSTGSTRQKTVSLPYSLKFDYSASSFKYISAQNNSATGTVRVEIFIGDSFISSGFCSSAYCIATTHN
jgi:hypothetical protein